MIPTHRRTVPHDLADLEGLLDDNRLGCSKFLCEVAPCFEANSMPFAHSVPLRPGHCIHRDKPHSQGRFRVEQHQ